MLDAEVEQFLYQQNWTTLKVVSVHFEDFLPETVNRAPHFG